MESQVQGSEVKGESNFKHQFWWFFVMSSAYSSHMRKFISIVTTLKRNKLLQEDSFPCHSHFSQSIFAQRLDGFSHISKRHRRSWLVEGGRMKCFIDFHASALQYFYYRCTSPYAKLTVSLFSPIHQSLTYFLFFFWQ